MKLKSLVYSFIVLLLTAFCLLAVDFTKYLSKAEGAELPSQYSMRDEYIIYAQHQDGLGYCWDFASTMAASTTIMKATGEYYDFSELWTGISLNQCSTSHKKIGQGGTMSYQYNAMQESGLMLESDLPYQTSYTVSNENAADYYNFYEKYSNHDLARCLVYDKATQFKKSAVDEIKNHIYHHGSVYMAFSFRTGFIEDGGAYYLEPNQKNTTSSHAVSVIGWDDDYQKEFYLDGAETPTVFKGAWMILNSYTEKSGIDGISYVFYNDNNVSMIHGYRYERDTSRDLYFYDQIEKGYAYPTYVKGKYYGDYTAESAVTKQKNIFYDDVDLGYSYTISDGASIKGIDIYLGNQKVTEQFNVRIDSEDQRFYIDKDNAAYGQYKVLVTYGNDVKSDTYLNNFFVTHGLVGEEIEFDYQNNALAYNTGLDLEYYSYIVPDKNYVIYTDKLSGEVAFLPTKQSVYSEKNMSIPKLAYEIKDGKSCTTTYTIKSNSGYELPYHFTFEYYNDPTLQPVNVYYDLGGGVNHRQNYGKELAGPDQDLILYEPTREGYTFAGWYLDYGNGCDKIPETDGKYYIRWEDIHHMGENPTLHATSHYSNYYKNSNTVFVYARWVEVDYYNVDLTILGEGASQIYQDIRVSEEDSVRYIFTPSSGYNLAQVEINGVAVSSEEMSDIIKYGLLLKNLDRHISIKATFAQGVYLSLKYGENIENAYVIGTKNGETQIFRDGDFIPSEYFSDTKNSFIFSSLNESDPLIDLPHRNDSLIDLPLRNDPLIVAPNKNNDLIIAPDKDDVTIIAPDKDDVTIIAPELNDKLPLLPEVNDGPSKEEPLPLIPFNSPVNNFVLVVELPENNPGYTYILEGMSDYSVVEEGTFKKGISISRSDAVKEIVVSPAVEKPVERTTIRYAVAESYIYDHYISADPNATSGDKNSAEYEAGQIVYLFIKTGMASTASYYRLPDGFESVDGQWYRRAIYVSADYPDFGTLRVYKETQSYTVTWKNWDGSVIYTASYRYGQTPKFYDRNGVSKDVPIRPDDEEYCYVFAGWDQPVKKVQGDVTYTATYEAVKRYFVNVDTVENGTITRDGDDYIHGLGEFTYTFTPNAGYRIKDVLVNGVSIGAVESYTFANVNGDQTLRVEFEKISYTVNVICGNNGSADITGAVQVGHGEDITIHITPAEFFSIYVIKVNGEPVTLSDTLTLSNVTQDTSVEITFEQTVFRITTVISGKDNATSSFTVSLGETAEMAFRAERGYRIKDVKIDGVSVGAVSNYTFENVAANHTVSVEYERIPLTVVLVSGSAVLLVGVVVEGIWLLIRLQKTRYLKSPLKGRKRREEKDFIPKDTQ